jgi:hypothetical protein
MKEIIVTGNKNMNRKLLVSFCMSESGGKITKEKKAPLQELSFF